MPDLDERLQAVELRNGRVEADKAWETSWLRRSLIAVITYGCGVVLLTVLGHDGAWRHAFVPLMGYVISTLSLDEVKKIWMNQRLRKKD